MPVENRIIWTLQDNVSAASAKLRKELDGVSATAKRSKGPLDNISKATGGMISPQLLAAGGAVALASAIGNITEAAIADEESQARLRASLAANIPGFDGNTTSIERNISAAQDLGFEDEALRDSLTVLSGATHDVGKAQKIMGTAMDLARFKGIDLRTASEALIKVEGGHYRALAQLGIKLKEGATSTEALAAVQKVAQGQAEAYAETNRGKLVASQIEVDEAMENLGRKTMPLVVAATTRASQAVTGLATGLDILTGSADLTDEAADSVAETIATGFIPAAEKAVDVLRDIQDAATDFASGGAKARDAADQLARSERTLGGVIGDLDDAFDDLADSADDSSQTVVASWGEMVDTMVSDVDELIGNAFDPIQTALDIADARSRLHAAEVERNEAKSKAAYREASKAAIDALEDEAEGLEALGKQHGLTTKDVDKFAKDARREYAHMSKSARAETEKLITKLYELAAIDGVSVKATVKLDKNGNIQRGGRTASAGGNRIAAGMETWVGEKGPELLRFNVPGRVISNPDSVGGGRGVGSFVYAPTYSTASPAEAQRFSRALLPELVRELRRQNVA